MVVVTQFSCLLHPDFCLTADHPFLFELGYQYVLRGPTCVQECVSLCEPRRELLWLAKLAKSLYEEAADGSSESISAAITKRINATTTTNDPCQYARSPGVSDKKTERA